MPTVRQAIKEILTNQVTVERAFDQSVVYKFKQGNRSIMVKSQAGKRGTTRRL